MAEIQGIVVEYFDGLFCSNQPSESQWRKVIESVPQKLPPRWGAYLDMPFSEAEVKKMVFDMFPTKAPGLDGSRNEQLNRSSFLADEANAIISLPLGLSQAKDSLLWHFDKSGAYTVKIGYRFGRMHLSREVPFGSKVVD
ncbi:hypothetical protein Ddye_006149 [Dipteronia dyeriana]|uniref:Uncharacterized protein n=1 Tax=Dipteronia dyeriana TaxID=168575 RepID=A0AAD9XI10_9ROSI|nr:hypothetical protein Ddye_006149 [Dipteronia dyeriana]